MLGLRFRLDADPATAKPEVIKGSLVEQWGDQAVSDITAENISPPFWASLGPVSGAPPSPGMGGIDLVSQCAREGVSL